MHRRITDFRIERPPFANWRRETESHLGPVIGTCIDIRTAAIRASVLEYLGVIYIIPDIPDVFRQVVRASGGYPRRTCRCRGPSSCRIHKIVTARVECRTILRAEIKAKLRNVSDHVVKSESIRSERADRGIVRNRSILTDGVPDPSGDGRKFRIGKQPVGSSV